MSLCLSADKCNQLAQSVAWLRNNFTLDETFYTSTNCTRSAQYLDVVSNNNWRRKTSLCLIKIKSSLCIHLSRPVNATLSLGLYCMYYRLFCAPGYIFSLICVSGNHRIIIVTHYIHYPTILMEEFMYCTLIKHKYSLKWL